MSKGTSNIEHPTPNIEVRRRREWTVEQAKILYCTIEALLNQFDAENAVRDQMKKESRKL